MTWLILALVVSNIAWAGIVFYVLIDSDSTTKKLTAYYEKQFLLTKEAFQKHTEEVIRKFQTEINAYQIRLEERDKQWQEYTATLTGKKVEA